MIPLKPGGDSADSTNGRKILLDKSERTPQDESR